MKKLVVPVLLLLLLAPAAAAQTIDPSQCVTDSTAPAEVETVLDTLLAEFVDPQGAQAGLYGYAPGAVFLVEGPDWRYYKAAGVADVTTGAPLNCAMPFQIGSNTKMMTGAVIMQLHEEGLLSIDDPLSKHLPDYAAALPFGDRMTLRHLATHTAGVFSYTDNAPNGVPGIMEGALNDPAMLALGSTPAELMQFVIANGQPKFEPGAEGEWAYSNTGFVLLGIIIEQLTGQPLAEAFEQRIFEPLGMADTFLWNDVPQAEFGLPSSYFQAPFDLETTTWNMSQGWAAGAVISTAEDMNVFIRALLAGALFKDEATLALMMDGVDAGGFPSPFQKYGIGLGLKQEGLWGHGGQTLGFESDVAYIPVDDLSIVIWTNAASDLAIIGATYTEQVLISAGLIDDPALVMARAALVSAEWQWQDLEFLTGEGTPPIVANPENYTLRFNEDGSFAFQADCNSGSGSYTLAGRDLTLAPGPMTLAACPPDSLADLYLQQLGAAASYGLDVDGSLLLITVVDGQVSQLRFAPAGA